MNETNRRAIARSVFTMSLFLILLLAMAIPANADKPGQLVIIVVSLVLNVGFIVYLTLRYIVRNS